MESTVVEGIYGRRKLLGEISRLLMSRAGEAVPQPGLGTGKSFPKRRTRSARPRHHTGNA